MRMIDFNANINEQYTIYILHVFFALFQLHDDFADSNNNTYVAPFIMYTYSRKGKYGRELFFVCFKCTYKLLLCPVALLFIHHFIIKGVHHLLKRVVENVISVFHDM